MKTAKKYLIIFFTLVLGLNLVQGQDKLAQTGFQFLSVGQSARAVALGNAFTTVVGTPNNMFYNPAGLAEIKGTVNASINYFNWIADIQHTSAAFTYTPSGGEYGVVGMSVQSVNYGDLDGTMVWNNSQGFVETGTFNPTALSVGLSYARALTDRFMVGGQIKLVGQYLGTSSLPSGTTKDNVANVVAFDFGTIYKTGFESLVFGMSVRNFSEEIKFVEESFQLPLTFQIGLSVNAADFLLKGQEDHAMWVTVDAVHPRSYPEYINLGLEYEFRKMFALRFGYISNQSQNDISLGFGVNQSGFSVNYAYQPFGVFGAINRFSAGISF
ncbi:MAG TPA: PorV/PorQ family protein [Caldithrix abyssi]|uniref:PorV/PorQ family protein n=1 Tax=Caldithrix abyssi TaxID=187145 RepID=A0A7V1PVK4_CALAY|nr:PorV/PorQ family protein [Caldithrix abyssi]